MQIHSLLKYVTQILSYIVTHFFFKNTPFEFQTIISIVLLQQVETKQTVSIFTTSVCFLETKNIDLCNVSIDYHIHHRTFNGETVRQPLAN